MIGDADVLSAHTIAEQRLGRAPRPRPEGDDPLSRRSDDLVRMIKHMKDEPGVRAVHRLRTTIRRVETLLPEDAARGSVRKLRKQLGCLRRRAGKVRDVDVHLKAAATLPASLAADGRDELRAALEKSRAKREKRLAHALADERDRGIVKRLRAVVARCDAAPPVGDAATRALTQVLADFASAHRARSPLGAGNLHAFRIATKRLRYRAEALVPHPDAAGVARELERAQDAIGTWHDWLTLEERAERVFEARVSPVLAVIRARTGTELAKALKTVERVAGRLAKVRPRGGRKGVRPVTVERARVPEQRTGASA
jgi:CHAD domain-containing protein